MARRARLLSGEDAERLPMPCQQCVYWELAGPCPQSRSGARREDPEAAVRKQAWVTAHVQAGSPPGRVLLLDDAVVGYALYAPADRFPPRGPLLPAVDRGALLLATIWVEPVHRGVGIGGVLLHAALRDAIHADLSTVQAYGDRRWLPNSCFLPVTWLLHEGFEVHREHPRTPLLQVDTRRTVRWAESLEHAVEEVLGRLPARAPAPVPAAGVTHANEH